jgi:AcrR family transcriptional regulator
MVEEQRIRGVGLDRERVLAAALEIADAEGLEALSFRRLAAHFEVTPMALYRYVESKEALLDGIGDLVLSNLELPNSQAGDWREQFRATAHSYRSFLVAHPATVPIFLSRPLFTPAGMRTADALIGLFRRAGFSTEEAVLRYQQVARYLLALVMLETGRPRLSVEERLERARVARITFETLPPDQYPHLVEAAPELAAPYDPERAFESGLDLLLAGLERMRAAQRSTRRPPRKR